MTPPRIRSLIAASLLAVSLLTGAAAVASPAAASGPSTTEIGRVNQARVAHGLAALERSRHLTRVARAQAARMANRNLLFHNPHLTEDVRHWQWVGENVGYGPDVATVHVAFMRSPAHRANVLDRDYTEIGVGVVVRGGRAWVVHVFRDR